MALLDWTMAEGLLADEHRPGLRALAHLVPIVLMVPGRWARLLRAEDLGAAALLAKPFSVSELLAALESADGWDGSSPPPRPRCG